MITLSQLEEQIAMATRDYDEASRAESVARNNTTAALNRLNDLQKQFRKIAESMQEKAPRDSEWGQLRSRRQAVVE